MKRLLLLLAVLLAFAAPSFAQLSVLGAETQVTYSGTTAALATNQPAVNFAAPGTNTFIMAAVPTVAARIYVTNDTANACTNSFQVSVATTGEKQITSFNNSINSWQLVPVINVTTGSYSANSGIVSIPANGTVIMTSAAVAGNNVAVFVVNTNGLCPTTNLDVVVVFTTVSITSPLISVATGGTVIPGAAATNVQGVAAAGATGTGILPVLVGELDNLGFLRANGKEPLGSDSSSNLQVARNLNSYGGQYSSSSIMAGGPLDVGVFGGRQDGVSLVAVDAQNHAGILTGGAGLETAAPGLFVHNSGNAFYYTTGVNASTSISINVSVGNVNGMGATGPMQACHFYVNSTTSTGTSPTLDIYVQDSDDNVTWNDRVHFLQATNAVAVGQWAGIYALTHAAPTNIQTAALAVSTSVDGPIGQLLRYRLIVGGSSVNFSVILTATCI